MSTDKTKTTKNAEPAGSVEPVRIRGVRLVTKGAIISSPKEAEDAVSARADGDQRGYDIFFHRDREEFRFDRYEDGKLFKRRWFDRTRIDSYEEWDPPAPPVPAAE